MEQEAQAVKSGESTADIKDPDEVIEEMDQEIGGGGAEFNADADDAGDEKN